MKKVAIGLLSLAAVAVNPSFADGILANETLAPMWSGIYLGAEIGGIWATHKLTETTGITPPLTGHAYINDSGFLGGGYVGYNWQMDHVVVGVEGDAVGTTLSKTSTCFLQDANAGNATPGACFPAGTYNFKVQLPWEASVRARLGVLAWQESTLLYVTGGVAFAEVDSSFATILHTPQGIQSFSDTRTGGTVGAGVEYRFADHWIGRAEYRYANFGAKSHLVTAAGGFWNGYTERGYVYDNTFRVGVSYLM